MNQNSRMKLRLKKKWIGLFLCVICFASAVLYTTASATPTLVVTATNPDVAGTDTTDPIIHRSESANKKYVTYQIEMKADQEWSSLKFTLNYDPAKLKLNEDQTSASKKYSTSIVPTAKSNANEVISDSTLGEIVWGVVYADSYINSDSVIGTVTFEVLDTASGTTDVTFKNYELARTDFDSFDEEVLTMTTKSERVFIEVPVVESSITLTTPSLDIDLGSANKTGSIVVDYSPKDTTDNKNFTYNITEGSDVVSVENGVVTGLKIGTAKIEVNAFGKTFEVLVSVKEHLQGIKITNAEIVNNSLKINRNTVSGPIALTTKTTPTNTSDTVTYGWTSSNTNVATVDNNGNVTVLANGVTRITVTATSAETGSVYTDNVVLNVTTPATGVDITDSDFTLDKNNNKTLNAVVTPSDTTDSMIWSSSNNLVATVDNNGKVTAIDRGEATITVTVGSVSDTVKVNVNVPVTDINVDGTDTITLLPNQTKKIVASVIPANANDQTINWSILDTNIATVDQNGLITAKASGETTLNIQSGTITKTRTIKVLKEVEGLSINIPSQTLKKGEQLNLIATPTTGAEETGKITWTSSDPTAATVDQSGIVTAIAPKDGSASTATITATWTSNMDANHKETVTSTITVIDPITKIELNKTKIELNGKGVTENLSITLTPNPTSSNKTITWTSSNPAVATVSNNGVVTSVSKGTTTITATTSNGLTASAEVVVTIPTTNVTIIGFKEKTMDINTMANLIAVVEPSDTTDTLTWTSSDDNIVSVNDLGLITAKNAGTAIITAKSGSKEDQVTVHVVIPVTSFNLVSANDIKVLKGTTSTIVTGINPENATDQKITWTSSDEEIASVNEVGIVTAKQEGTVVITGSLSNGMKVNVNVEVEIIPITDMELTTDTLEMKRKEKTQLELILKPENTTERDQIIWTSSDEEVASVDEFGFITGKQEGTATITATYKDLEVTAEVNVTEIHLESIAFENVTKELNVGDTTKLNVTLNPIDVTDDLVYTYTSSDENIATIDEDGMITAKNAGTVTFTVEVNGIKSTHEMTIRKVVNPQTGISSVAGYGVIALVSLMIVGFLIRKKANLK